MGLFKAVVVRLLLWLTLLGSLFCIYAASEYVLNDLPKIHFNDAFAEGRAEHLRYTMMQDAVVLAPALLSLLSVAGLLIAGRRERSA